MHVHFDEAKFEQDLRRVFAEMSADPEIHTAGSVIIDRNREISVQMGMMMCRELNRGTDLHDIADASITVFLEFFGNLLSYVQEETHQEVAMGVLQELAVGLAQIVNQDPTAFQHGNPATMQEIKGGRA